MFVPALGLSRWARGSVSPFHDILLLPYHHACAPQCHCYLVQFHSVDKWIYSSTLIARLNPIRRCRWIGQLIQHFRMSHTSHCHHRQSQWRTELWEWPSLVPAHRECYKRRWKEIFCCWQMFDLRFRTLTMQRIWSSTLSCPYQLSCLPELEVEGEIASLSTRWVGFLQNLREHFRFEFWIHLRVLVFDHPMFQGKGLRYLFMPHFFLP